MHQPIIHHLEFLYGKEVAEGISKSLSQILAPHLRKKDFIKHESSCALPLDQSDCLLITYADQVTQPGQTPIRSLGEFLSDYVREVIKGIHFLPFFPWSSDDGFSVIDYRRIDPVLGSWDDVQEVGREFKLMFDAVFNHISAESEWFKLFLADHPKYRDFFVVIEGDPDLSAVVRPRAVPLLTQFETSVGPKKVWTTFSADQIDLNIQNPEVLLELVDILLQYVGYGARFIRLDAIGFLWKTPGTPCIHLEETHRVIQLFRCILQETYPDVLLITETNVPHKDNISYFGDGTNEAQLVYNFALPPLVFHAVLRGDATVLSKWAAELQYPSDAVTYFNFLASHDGIGLNPARGILPESEITALCEMTQRHGGFVSYKNNPDGSKSPYELNINFFDALSNPSKDSETSDLKVARFLLAQAVMLALKGMPGIYFHSLFGSKNDRAGAEASGIPRRINRQKFTRTELEQPLSIPESIRSRVFQGFKKLLSVRTRNEAFHPAGNQSVMHLHPSLFALKRSSPSGETRVLAIHNLSQDRVQITLATDVMGDCSEWIDLLTERPIGSQDRKVTISLEAYAIFWAQIV